MEAVRSAFRWDSLVEMRDPVVKRVLAADATTLALSAMVTAAVAFFVVVLLRMLSRSSPSPSSGGRPLSSLPGPPSPSWYSISGNALELYDCPNKSYPVVFMEWVRKYGSVFTYRFGRFRVLVISDPELVREVCLKSFKTFHDRSTSDFLSIDDRGFLASSGKYWASVRGAAQPLFHSVQLKNFLGIMQRTTSILMKKLKSVSPGQKVKISDWFHTFSIDTIAEAAFGIPFGVQEQSTGQEKALMDALIADLQSVDMHEGMDLVDCLEFLTQNTRLLRTLIALLARIPGTERYKQRKNLTVIERECQKIVQNREMLMGSFLTSMTKVKIDNPSAEGKHRGLMPSELSSLVREILAAGTDTSANTLTNAIYLLHRNPQVKAKLRIEIDEWYKKRELLDRGNIGNLDGQTELFPDANDLVQFPYLTQVVNEVLRMFPTVAITDRVALEDYQLGDLLIPKGAAVEIPMCAMHHCPKMFPNPEEFRPERFDPSSEEDKCRHPYAFLPFGLGPRMCLGRSFAMLELKLVLFKLYRSFDLRVVEENLTLDAYGNPEWDAGITVQMKGGLNVTVHPRE